MHKIEFGQVYYVDLPKRIHTKFTLKILVVSTNFYEFLKFALISIFINKNWK
jgi:hypothetical protein